MLAENHALLESVGNKNFWWGKNFIKTPLMGKGFGFLALAVLAGVTMPSFAIAAPVDTQQQIIAI